MGNITDEEKQQHRRWVANYFRSKVDEFSYRLEEIDPRVIPRGHAPWRVGTIQKVPESMLPTGFRHSQTLSKL